MLLEKLRNDYMQAMKDKDTLKKGTYSLLISAINMGSKEKGSELTDEETCVYIQRELKQTHEALSLTPESRVDLLEANNAKIELLKKYLPKQMTPTELNEAIMTFANEEGLELQKRNQGLITKGIMKKYGSKTDGKTINQMLSKILG